VIVQASLYSGKIDESEEISSKAGMNSGAPEGYEVPAPLVDILVTHMTIKLPGCGYTTQGSL
jgi:hypothetical protein